MSSEQSIPASRKRERAILRLARISALQKLRQELSELGFAIDALEHSRREVEREVIAQVCLPENPPRDQTSHDYPDGTPGEQLKASEWTSKLASIERELVAQYQLFDALVQLREREENYYNQKLGELREN